MKIKNRPILLLLSIIITACAHRATEQTEKAYTLSGDTVYLQSERLLDKTQYTTRLKAVG